MEHLHTHRRLYLASTPPLPGGHCQGNPEILCADLSRNHTARALAERFQVSETSLKKLLPGRVRG